MEVWVLCGLQWCRSTFKGGWLRVLEVTVLWKSRDQWGQAGVLYRRVSAVKEGKGDVDRGIPF